MKFYKTKNSIRKQNQAILDNQEKKINSLTKTIEGGLFEPSGLKYDVESLTLANKGNANEFNAIKKRLTVLEEIVREAGLITDFEDDEVKIREDRTFDIYNGIRVKHTPYQINKVKVI